MPKLDISKEIQLISSGLRDIGYNVSPSLVLDADGLVLGRIVSHDNSYSATFLSNGALNVFIRGDSDFVGFLDALLALVKISLPKYAKTVNIF